MKHLTRLAPLLVAGALGIAACGGSDSSAGESGSDAGSAADTELADALAAQWESDETFPASLSSECLASAFVTGIGGAEGAEGYGVNADNVGDRSFDENPLEEDDALGAAGEMYKCDGFKTAFLTEVVGVEGDAIECLASEISDEPLVGLIASGFMGDNSGVLEEQFENTFESELFEGVDNCDIEL